MVMDNEAFQQDIVFLVVVGGGLQCAPRTVSNAGWSKKIAWWRERLNTDIGKFQDPEHRAE